MFNRKKSITIIVRPHDIERMNLQMEIESYQSLASLDLESFPPGATPEDEAAKAEFIALSREFKELWEKDLDKRIDRFNSKMEDKA